MNRLIASSLGSKGYSLTEFIVVIGISSLLATVTIPRLLSSASELSLKRSSNDVLQLANTASNFALRANCDLELEFGIGKRDVAIRQMDETCSKLKFRPRSYRLPKKLKFAAASFGNLETHKNSLIVRANATATPGRIEVKAESGKSCTITQTLRGARKLKC